MQPSRRVLFNPTSLPVLRTRAPRPQRREFYNGTSRVGIGGLGNNARLGRWKSVRKESTETGEDKTGHISASANEGILFFDSKFYFVACAYWKPGIQNINLPVRLNDFVAEQVVAGI
jgi:hypothetical protein